jgi:ubiquinone/menaquinone biosynthesis C-methylase UbiE
LVRAGFRLLYHEFAWSYDLVAWLVSCGQWQNWGRAALPYLVGEHVLELGHGPGHLLVTLAQEGFQPVGLDLSPQMGRLARRRLRRSRLALTLVRGRAQRLPFAACTFDSIVATFPTPYIVEPATLAQVVRTLRPHGRLVVVTSAQLKGSHPFVRFIEWLYVITGQREVLDGWEAPFTGAGLALRQVSAEIGRSQVWLLIAEPATPDDRR